MLQTNRAKLILTLYSDGTLKRQVVFALYCHYFSFRIFFAFIIYIFFGLYIYGIWTHACLQLRMHEPIHLDKLPYTTKAFPIVDHDWFYQMCVLPTIACNRKSDNYHDLIKPCWLDYVPLMIIVNNLFYNLNENT